MTQHAALALESAAAEIETHVGQAGWDRPPALFALVGSAELAIDEPALATRLGVGQAAGDALTPIEQETLPAGALDEVLAQLAWPESVSGCALSQEIVILPPSAEPELPAGSAALRVALTHPERREARLVVAVLRDGSNATVLRLRGIDGAEEDLLTGSELAPNLAAALVATLS